MLTPRDEISLEGVDLVDHSNTKPNQNDGVKPSSTGDANTTIIDTEPSITNTTSTTEPITTNTSSSSTTTDSKTAGTDRDWNTFIGEKAVVLQKSLVKIAEVSAVTRDKIVEVSAVARVNLSKSISVVSNIAAEKAGLLVGKV
jgi:hypothetical protein